MLCTLGIHPAPHSHHTLIFLNQIKTEMRELKMNKETPFKPMPLYQSRLPIVEAMSAVQIHTVVLESGQTVELSNPFPIEGLTYINSQEGGSGLIPTHEFEKAFTLLDSGERPEKE